MRTGLLLSVATALTFLAWPCAEAKEHYIVKEDVISKEHHRPQVEGITEKCAYDSDSFKLCGKYGASVKAGWEWEQEYFSLTEDGRFYKLRLDIFLKQGLDLEGFFFADRIFSSELSILLQDFKALVSFQIVRWYASGRTCMAGFYALDDLVFEILMRLRFIEASKNIIEHLWTLDNWDSIYAKYLDDFGLSDYEPVTLFLLERQLNDD